MITLGTLSGVLPPEAIEEVIDGLDPVVVSDGSEFVVRPGSTDEVATIMSWASLEGVGVLPVGSGRRCRPVCRVDPYIVLSTQRLVGIEAYEAGDLTLTAKAGTSFATVNAAARERGQWVPFDPPHVERRSLGGLVCSGESGPLWMGYGELRNHVLGMTVVTGDGRVLRLGGRVVKNVAGFDLLKPMVGSRGTLAVVASVCLRVFPEPAVDRVLLLRGETVPSLAGAAQAVGTAPIMPASSVLVGRTDLFGEAALVVRLHGAVEQVDAERVVLERHLGVSFETVEVPLDATKRIADHGADAPVVIVASARPSTLSDFLAVIERLGPSALAIDCYAVRARMGLDQLDAEAVRHTRDSIERLGGALRVIRMPDGESQNNLCSRRETSEIELIEQLEKIFDPMGVLWPTR